MGCPCFLFYLMVFVMLEWSVAFGDLLKEMCMAQDQQQMERLWIQKALEFQRQALIRSLTKEMPGSDIYALRKKEIDLLQSLVVKYS